MNNFSSVNLIKNDKNSSKSNNDNTRAINGIVKDYSMDKIPVRLIYDIMIKNNNKQIKVTQETNDFQTNFKNEELSLKLNSIIESYCRPIFLTNSIISLPNAIKQDKNKLLEIIKMDLSSQEVNVEKFSIKVLTTPELKEKKGKAKIISCILNLIYIIGAVLALFVVYYFK